MEEKRWIVEEGGMRLDVFLREKSGFSRALVQEWIREGRVEIAGKKVTPHYRLHKGEEVILHLPPPSPPLEGENIPLRIIYEDESILVVDKPPGMVVHPAGRKRKGTLVNALLYHYPDSLSRLGGETRRGLVHRLDKGTSGVMVIARTDKAHQILSSQFREREVRKTYLALVWGKTPPEGKIDLPIGRDIRFRQKMGVNLLKGRDAVTTYRVRERFPGITFLEVYPLTGRTHQIRVHLSVSGYPIVGDPLYGGKNFKGSLLEYWKKNISRPLLHAWRLTIRHPEKDTLLTFEAPLPEDFQRVLDFLRRQ